MKLPFEYAILGVLIKGPRHGYEIHRLLLSALGAVWRAGMSNTYALLKKLEAEGHVLSTIEAHGIRPAKRVFTITEKGKGAFNEWVSNPVHNIRDVRVEFMGKLYFVKELGLPGGEELVEGQRAVCQGILDALDRSAWEAEPLLRLLFDFRACQIRSILSWLDTCSRFLGEATDKSQGAKEGRAFSY